MPVSKYGLKSKDVSLFKGYACLIVEALAIPKVNNA